MASELATGKVLKRADPSTIQDKFMVGYQGWFTCAGDGKPLDPNHHGWLHWFDAPLPSGGHINTDLWPDFSEYSPSELYPAPGLHYENGDQAFLFSSRNAKSVQRHFHWMATHGVDGAFLQRFAGQVTPEDKNMRDQRDEIGDLVRAAAEKEGRVFAIMYDVSGVSPDRIQKILEDDWVHLVRHKGILDSPNYLREKGMPVIAIWGFGLADRNHTPASVRGTTSYLRNVTPGGAYLMAGVAAHWRTSTSDADPNPEFVNIWLNEFDAISPWTVGRYGNEDDADRFAAEKIKGDVELINRRSQEGHRKVDYIPVVLPGGSGYNTSRGQWGFNDIKRNGGRFLWKQVYNVRHLGVRIIYGAMWDEYDEGTAFMPVVPYKRQLPKLDGVRFMALDEEGHDLPPDWYMRICGYAAEILKGERMIHETFPVKELQDFWSSRPRYEEEGGASNSGSGSGLGFGAGGQGQTYQEWLAAQGDEKNDAPPPPYSLEAAASAPAPRVPASTRPLSVSGAGRPDPALQSRLQTSSSRPQAPPAIDPSSRPPAPPHHSTSVSPSAAPAVLSHTPNLRVQAPPAVDSNTRPYTQLHHTPTIGQPPPSPVPYGVSSLSQDFSRQSLSPGPVPHTQPPPSPSQGPWTQGQWPPSEWGTNQAQQQPAEWSTYPGQGGQAHHHSPYPPSAPPIRPRPATTYSPPHSPPPQTHGPPLHRPPGPSFPQAHSSAGDGAYFGMPTPQQFPYQAYSGSPHAAPSNPHQFPQPQGFHTPPPIPPRPYGAPSPQPGYGPQSPPLPPPPHPSFAAAPPPPLSPSSSSGPFGFALNAVDRVAGEQRRRQLERGVGSLTQTGSKLFNKFTK